MTNRKRMLIAFTLCVSMAAAIPSGTLCYAQENTDTCMAEPFAFEEEPGDTKIQSVIDEETDYAPGEVMVVIKKEYSELNKEYAPEDFPGVEIQEIEYVTSLRESAEGTLIDLANFRQILLLHLVDESKQGVRDAIAVLNENEIVMSADPNYIWEYEEPEPKVIEDTLLIDETAIWNEALAQNAAVTPNDPLFSQQTNMALVNAPAAWALTTGNKAVKVGVIDTGIAYHPDLAANVVDGWDFVENKSVKFADLHGHGTHVAGIIGAIGNNGAGVAGVAWNIQLVPLRSSHEGSGKASLSVKAIDYAEEQGIPILNYSRGIWNIDGYPPMERSIDAYKGLFVCSAGNEGINIDNVSEGDSNSYPSAYDCERMISVANCTNNGFRYGYSNYGTISVDLAAPGVNVWSTWTESTYKQKTGTSMAAPQVTGAAALLLSLNSDATPYQLKEIILSNVKPCMYLDSSVATEGMLDIGKAAQAILKDRVENYKLITKYTGNETVIHTFEQQTVYNRNLFRLVNYTLGGQPGTVVRDDDTHGFTVWDDYLLVDRQEGTILEERFNSVTEITEDPQNLISAKDPVFTCSVEPHFYSYCVKMGDVNGDGSVTSEDSLLVQKAVVKLVTLTEEQITAADVNESDTVDASDAREILDYIVRNINSFW